MSKSLKGLLLSGLVLPGLGQMVLKRYLRGLIFMGITIGALVVIIVQGTQDALKILETVNSDQMAVGFDQIANATDQAMADISSPLYRYALMLIVLAWVVAAVDAFLIGRKMDGQPRTPSSHSAGLKGE